MATYAYKARDSFGKLIKGIMEASSKDEVIKKLSNMGHMVIHIAETKEAANKISIFDKFLRPSTEHMVMFYIQLSNMLNAGLPILSCLKTLTGQISNKRLKEAVSDVARSIEGGNNFSDALSRHPDIFPKLFSNMVKAGETSGTLDVLISRYAKYFESQTELGQKVKGALFYPAILLMAGISVTLFIVTFVIPQFVEIFMKVGVRLPMPTLVLYIVGIGIKKYWYLIILFISITYMAINYYVKTEKGRLNFDRFKLELPITGELSERTALSRFTKTLATLLASGVPILESLDVTSEVVGNEVISGIIKNVRKSVEKGETIAEPLKISGRIPDDTVHMISVGEKSGKLDEMLEKLADFYDISIGYTIKKLTTVLEPLFLLIMGALVGFIMASMLLPIFDMVKVLRQ